MPQDSPDDTGPNDTGRDDKGSDDARPVALSGSLDSLVPIVVFVVVNRFAGLRWAVAAATAGSLQVVVSRHRRGIALGRFVPLITVAVIGRGIIGVVTDSETVYFGLGIATKYVVAAALSVSVLIRRPLGVVAAITVFPTTAAAADHSGFRSTMSIVTLIAGAYYAVSASFDIWLFRRSSVEGYVIIRFLVNWPLSIAAVVAALVIMRRRLPSVPGLTAMTSMLGVPAD